MAAAGINTIKT
ncbi:hypothetical protein VCHC50A1_0113, partial [Vibrio cholerae HC-50A1]